jgi:hypothetical protein
VSVKLKLALVWFVGFAGFEVILGGGGDAAVGLTPTIAVCHPMGALYWNCPA